MRFTIEDIVKFPTPRCTYKYVLVVYVVGSNNTKFIIRLIPNGNARGRCGVMNVGGKDYNYYYYVPTTNALRPLTKGEITEKSELKEKFGMKEGPGNYLVTDVTSTSVVPENVPLLVGHAITEVCYGQPIGLIEIVLPETLEEKLRNLLTIST